MLLDLYPLLVDADPLPGCAHLDSEQSGSATVSLAVPCASLGVAKASAAALVLAADRAALVVGGAGSSALAVGLAGIGVLSVARRGTATITIEEECIDMSGGPFPGTSVVATVTFKDAAGALADPDGDITIMVRTPAGDETSHVFGVDPDVTKPSVGVYKKTHELDTSGKWRFRGKGTGSVTAADEETFEVKASGFAAP